jgi:hypothetical protein
MVDLVGSGGDYVASFLCFRRGVPLVDLRQSWSIGRQLTEAPTPCIFLADSTHAIQTHKSGQIFFCLTDRPTPGRTCFRVPGTTEDKLDMLLYCAVPRQLQDEPHTRDRLRPVSELMIDYGLIQGESWHRVVRDGTLSDYISTSLREIRRISKK